MVGGKNISTWMPSSPCIYVGKIVEEFKNYLKTPEIS